MSATPPPNPDFNKLSRDAAQYQQAQVARRHPQAARAGRSPAARPTRPEPAWTELDTNLGWQILTGLLIAAYAISMLAACVAVFLVAPSLSPVLWAVVAAGVIVSMIAYHKGRPPMLWFMYASTLTMVPLVHVLLAGRLRSFFGGPAPTVLEALVFAAVLAAVPLVHVLLVTPAPAVLDARELARGMKPCPSCAEMIRGEARVCPHCRREVIPAPAAR